MRSLLLSGQRVSPERLIVSKQDGVLGCVDEGGHESRNDSVRRLISQASDQHGVPDFAPTVVSTADRPVPGALCFSTSGECPVVAVPDFLFDGWPETGVPDYEEACRELAVVGGRPAARPVCGWIGNVDTSPIRRVLMAVAGRSRLLEAWHTPWPPDGSQRLSLVEQVQRWAFLLDVEGNGWSARLKLLLHSGRPVLVADRPWREWWFEKFEPWEHFIPVSRDLTDLGERVEWARQHEAEAGRIGRAGQEFAQGRLTRAAAVERWADVLGGLSRG